MKMAKASEKDLQAAADISHALNSIDGNYMPSAFQDEDGTVEFDLDNAAQCRLVLEHLMEKADCSRLFRVVYGMQVLLDPSNKAVDPDADTIEFHPDTIAARQDSDRLKWLTEDHQDPAVREKCREIIARMPGMSYSAVCADIDAATAGA